MSDLVHPAATLSEVHTAFRWKPANAAARNAIVVGTPFTDDVGCLAWQLDDNTVWLAKATGTGSSKWQQVGAAAAGTLIGPGTSTDLAVVSWNGIAGVTLRNNVLIVPASGDPTVDLHITKKAYVDKQVREFRSVKKVAAGGGTTYTISATDELIECDTLTNNAALTLNLQCYANANFNGLTVHDQAKNAANKNIIVHPEAGKSINGGTAGANLLLTASGGTWVFWRYSDGSGYGVSGPV